MMRIVIILLMLASRLWAADSYKAQVTAGTDDAKSYGNNLSTGEVDAVVGYASSYSCDYLARFTNVAVPSGAVIDSVFLSLHCSSSQSGTTCNALIYAEDTNSATTFSNWNDYNSRWLTTTSTAWNNIGSQTFLIWYRTPDIKDIVQEVIDRGGWSSGNDLAVFIQDNNSENGAFRRYYQYERTGSNGTSSCSLLVYYNEGTTGGDTKARRRHIIQNPMGNYQPMKRDEGQKLFGWEISCSINTGRKNEQASFYTLDYKHTH